MGLAGEVQHFPRHLGIHSGGMVLCDRPVAEVCPVEWARMADRSVLQWDKDDCAAAGLVKFDMLGLGMLTVLHATVDHVRAFHGSGGPGRPAPGAGGVRDAVPGRFGGGVPGGEPGPDGDPAPAAAADVLRPGGGGGPDPAGADPGGVGAPLHPPAQRDEAVTYLHPLLERSLAKTLGVPLFQEQLMQMAIDVAGFTPAESDRLRQAMGSKRSVERMEQLRARLYAGMAERGIIGEVADAIWEKLVAFANFGFPESHSVSFAYLVYSSAWLKHHYPAAFCAGLLDGQPMGFWSPQTIVRRPPPRGGGAPAGRQRQRGGVRAGSRPVDGGRRRRAAGHLLRAGDRRRPGGAHRRRAAVSGMEDVVRRTGVTAAQAEALATAGAFECFGLSRRQPCGARAPWPRPDRAMAVPARPPHPPRRERHQPGATPAMRRTATGRAAGSPAAGVRAAGSPAAGVRAAGSPAAGVRAAGVRAAGVRAAGGRAGRGLAVGVTRLPAWLGSSRVPKPPLCRA